jgi:hypothetical protein
MAREKSLLERVEWLEKRMEMNEMCHEGLNLRVCSLEQPRKEGEK